MKVAVNGQIYNVRSGGKNYTAGQGVKIEGNEISVIHPNVPITQAEYDALTDEKKHNGSIYIITDEEPSKSLEIYSTEEVQIGTWIDGRPLYRKTIVTTSPVANGSTSSFKHWISDIDIIVRAFGCINGKRNGKLSSYFITIPNVYMSSTANCGLAIDKDNISFWLNSGSDPDFYDCPAYITIEYTKTTD